MTTAKFPGQTCITCGAEFTPRVTEIAVHPTITGPKGGKKFVHAHPEECSAKENPYAHENAGRRTFWDKNYPGGARSVPKEGRKPPIVRTYVAPKAGVDKAYIHKEDMLGMSARDLAGLSTSTLEGVANLVIAELEARHRYPNGRNMAWGPGAAPKFKNVKARD